MGNKWAEKSQPHQIWRWEGAGPALKVSMKRTLEGVVPLLFQPDIPGSLKILCLKLVLNRESSLRFGPRGGAGVSTTNI